MPPAPDNCAQYRRSAAEKERREAACIPAFSVPAPEKSYQTGEEPAGYPAPSRRPVPKRASGMRCAPFFRNQGIRADRCRIPPWDQTDRESAHEGWKARWYRAYSVRRAGGRRLSPRSRSRAGYNESHNTLCRGRGRGWTGPFCRWIPWRPGRKHVLMER